MQYGVRIIEPLLQGLSFYMATNNIKNVKQLIGARLNKVMPLDQVERGKIVYPNFNRNKCIKCGRCYISCRDGGQNALQLDKQGYPMLNSKKCVGCHLCTFVCPNQAITAHKELKKR
ncbi:MAG: 4Fe-4S binding protein [Mycoplasmoidaceae bacterium]|nr:4Fe-4S binding protein [Mycoplasmoidaceae bacterium]